MLSFVITAFNRPKALRTCLSSLVQQTWDAWEALVVDNSDSEPDRLDNIDLCSMDRRIHHCRMGDDAQIEGAMHKYSLYKATEIGVANTSGEWLCFPSDDSYYVPWFVERMMAAAQGKHWDLVYCDLIAGGAGGHWVLEASPKRCCIDKTSFLLRREWFHGFPDATGESYADADGRMIEELVERGIRHGRVSQVLAVHN